MRKRTLKSARKTLQNEGYRTRSHGTENLSLKETSILLAKLARRPLQPPTTGANQTRFFLSKAYRQYSHGSYLDCPLLRVFIDLSAFHNEGHAGKRRDICNRIAFDSNDVGLHSRRDGADSGTHVQRFCGE